MLIDLLTKNIAILPILGACAAFAWGAFQFLTNLKRESEEAQFKRFHDVMRKIQHDFDEGRHTAPYIEIQIAAVYELRFLTRYHSVSEIYLSKKTQEWHDLGEKYESIGVPVILNTLDYIKKGTLRIRLKRSFISFYKDNPFI
ncbi:hypothetical protein ACKVM9_002900 [Pantoea agglomerans]|jgi:hypothetical protein|uniref:hypothetical protein n=1 Tax=Enterobacter agglomerans TaxID=549 RepID=UPI00390C218F